MYISSNPYSMSGESDNQRKESNSSSIISRRNALRYSGSAVAGVALPFEIVAGALGGKAYDGELVSVRRTKGNALTPDQVYDLQTQAASKARKKLGGDIKIGKSKTQDDVKIYAFSYRIDSNGNVAGYVGFAPSDNPPQKSTVARLHNSADQFEQKVAESALASYDLAEAEDQSLVSTAKAGSVDTEWGDPVDSFHYELADDPYGVLYHRGDVYEYVDSDEDVIAYLMDQVVRPNPGINEYGSDWKQDLALTKNDWGVYQGGSPELDEYKPQGDKSGDYSVYATGGYETAEITIQYDPPKMIRTDNSQDVEDYMALKWNFEAERDSPQTFDVYSQMRTTSQASTYDSLVENTSQARWRHQYTLDTHRTKSSWTYSY